MEDVFTFGMGYWVAEEYDIAGRVLRSVICDTEESARETCAYWERVRGSRTAVFGGTPEEAPYAHDFDGVPTSEPCSGADTCPDCIEVQQECARIMQEMEA